MKKVVLADLRKFSIVEEAEPKLSSEHDVLIKIASVGICGSDIHYFRTGAIGDQIVDYPFTPGHECTGTVVETGAKVRTVNVNDPIAIDPAVSCGTCDQCLADRKHTCRNLKFLGNPAELSGCLQEYFVLADDCCFRLPETISQTDGVIIEPLTIGLHAVSFNNGKANFAILGCGPIGMSTLFALKIHFPTSGIFVTDKIDSRLSFSLAKGAQWAGNPLKVNVVEEILKSNPHGIDAVFECCGQVEAISQAIDLLKPGGQLIIIGIPEQDQISVDAHNMRRKEISIHNVRRQNNKYHEAIKILAEKRIDINGVVSHQFDVGQVQEAFELVESYADGVMKAIVRFDQ
jgi:L-iditol 2-dehydrogenase